MKFIMLSALCLFISVGCKNKAVELKDEFANEYLLKSKYATGVIELEYAETGNMLENSCIDNKSHAGWSKYNNSTYSCFYPSEWNQKANDKYLFYAKIDSVDYHYVVGISYDATIIKMNTLFDYIAEVHGQMNSDTIEKMISENYYYMHGPGNRSLFFGEFKTQRAAQVYTIYACYTEVGSLIFDHTIKFSDNSVKYCDFVKFLCGIKFDDKKLYEIRPESGVLKLRFPPTNASV